MKTREQNRNNKRTEIERFDWFVERTQMHAAFGWLSERSFKKTPHALELSRNQSILRFDVILQREWPIEQCLHHIRVFFGGKMRSPCFDLLIHWLIKQITNTYRNHFSRSYENRCICKYNLCEWKRSLSECFSSRGQQLCKCIGTKRRFYIRKRFNSHRIGLWHQLATCWQHSVY